MAPAVAGMIAAHQARVLPDTFDPLEAAIAGLKAADQSPSFDDQDRLIRYRTILETSFGSHVVVPRDPDGRDEFELVKRKLERRISDIAGSPNTISSVAARYYAHNVIKPGVQAKYRRNIQKLIDYFGDIPVGHLTSKMLRKFRDAQSACMTASSLQSVFTPIKGMLCFAVQEEIIADNPYGAVELQKEKDQSSSGSGNRLLPTKHGEFFELWTRSGVHHCAVCRKNVVWLFGGRSECRHSQLCAPRKSSG